MRKRLYLFIAFITTAITTILAANDDALYRYLFIEAVRQQDLGNSTTAYELFRRCHNIRPEASETAYSLGILCLSTGQDSLGMSLMKQANATEPDNTEYAEALARIYLYKDSMMKAADVYEQLVDSHADRTDLLEMLARIYEKQRDYPKMLSALERIETQEGKSESLTLSKMRVYDQMGDTASAVKEIKGLMNHYPNDMTIRVMMGNWMLANGRKGEALALFREVMEKDSTNASGQMSLMDYYRADGDDAKADSMMYNMLINPRTEPQTRATLLSDWIKSSEQRGGDSLHTMQLLDRVLQLPQTTSEVATVRVAYMMLKNAPSDSIKAGWRQVLDITPEDMQARLGLIQLMWQDTIDDNVIDECKKAVEYLPDEPVLYYYLGMAQFINDKTDDALATMQRGAANITSETNPQMAADIYASLGDMLQKTGKTTEAFAAYDSALIYNPNQVLVLNNYAYFLSLENKDLKRAEKMSYRAISADANSGTYLDTYAWILYKQGRYEEARIYIDQAIDAEEKEWRQHNVDADAGPSATDSTAVDTIVSRSKYVNADILDHAGDIYYRLGRISEALDFWQSALDGDIEDKATIRKKIKRKRL